MDKLEMVSVVCEKMRKGVWGDILNDGDLYFVYEEMRNLEEDLKEGKLRDELRGRNESELMMEREMIKEMMGECEDVGEWIKMDKDVKRIDEILKERG